MPLNTIRAVSFDAAGTLLEPHPSVGALYAEVAKQFGIETTADTMNIRFLRAWKQRGAFDYSEEAWARLVEETFQDLAQPDQFPRLFPALYARFARPDAWRIYEDVRPTLDALKRRGLVMAILSNWDSRLRPVLEGHDIAAFFAEIVISAEVGVHKPDPKIFHLLSARLGLEPAQILHVGDGAREDAAGAEAAGMPWRLVDRSGGVGPDGSTITTLRGLLSVVPHGSTHQPA